MAEADPRTGRRRRLRPLEIVFIVLLAVAAGAASIAVMEHVPVWQTGEE